MDTIGIKTMQRRLFFYLFDVYNFVVFHGDSYTETFSRPICAAISLVVTSMFIIWQY
jgi:hypothetical protein